MVVHKETGFILSDVLACSLANACWIISLDLILFGNSIKVEVGSGHYAILLENIHIPPAYTGLLLLASCAPAMLTNTHRA